MRHHRAGTFLACVVAGMALTGPALAARGSSERPPAIMGEIIHRGTRAYVGPHVAARPSVLPLTGAEITLFAATGCAAVAAGTAIVGGARARRPS